MPYRAWNVRTKEKKDVLKLQEELGIGNLLGSVLAARGFANPNDAKKILNANAPLPSPFAMKDMQIAVERIHKAIKEDEAIAVFGDYDADGITATAILYTYLESLGANVFYKLPSRNNDDYGLSPAIVEMMAEKGIGLIITVDNGTSVHEAAVKAQQLGVSIVVTDHHLPSSDTLPDVHAIVNPCLACDESGLEMLSGAGVAFMLVAALEDCAPEELFGEYADLCAIGTVADVMKLRGANRTIVSAGLSALQSPQKPGLRALITACGLGEKGVTVDNISYGIAPRINAAGRMDDATYALRLLLAEDEDEVNGLVENLSLQNAARQKAEAEIIAIIDEEIAKDTELLNSRVLVIWGDGWHQGVIGIVASRLVDKYARPCIVITFDGDEGKGSGRSVAGFVLHSAIASCEDILVRFGGHDLAAGFSIKKQNVKSFRKRLNKWAAENVNVMPVPQLWADTEIEVKDITVEAVEDLDRLMPYGSGNPAPVFLLNAVILDAVYPVSDGKHSRLRFKQGEDVIYAVLFGIGPSQLAYKVGDELDVMLVLSLFEGKQGAQASARVCDMRPAGMRNVHVQQSALVEKLLLGLGLSEDDKLLLTPSREDAIDIYRILRAEETIIAADLRPVFAKLGERRTAKLLVALNAFLQLGLIEKKDEDDCYHIVKVSEKRELANSPVMQKLSK